MTTLAYPGFAAGGPPAWNAIRAPKAALNPAQAVLPTAARRPPPGKAVIHAPTLTRRRLPASPVPRPTIARIAESERLGGGGAGQVCDGARIARFCLVPGRSCLPVPVRLALPGQRMEQGAGGANVGAFRGG
jgi:hypothetical protein